MPTHVGGMNVQKVCVIVYYNSYDSCFLAEWAAERTHAAVVITTHAEKVCVCVCVSDLISNPVRNKWDLPLCVPSFLFH